LSSSDSRTLFSRFRRSQGRSPNTIRSVVVDDVVFLDDVDKVRSLNSYFSSVGQEGKSDDFDDSHRDSIKQFLDQRESYFACREGSHLPENSAITLDEVSAAVGALRSRAACGSDGIHSRMLQQGGPLVVRSLLHIFNVSWRQGILVSDWKLAHIVPIPKEAGACRPPDFRPISLLSIVAKIMGKIVARRLTFCAESGMWFSDFQGAFRTQRSAIDQLLAFSHRVSHAFSHSQVGVTAFLDISKAFDRVWRDGLLFKLVRFGLRGRMLHWIRDFLADRRGRVRYADVLSNISAYHYGIPQGSVLSPVLFNVFLSDIVRDIPHSDSSDHAVFADDVRLSVYDACERVAADRLSRQLSVVHGWARRNRVYFRKDKCKYLLFSRRRHISDLAVSFGGTSLLSCEFKRYLGVWWDRSLSFRYHVSQVRAKAWRSFCMVRRVAGVNWGASISSMIKLYVTFVRPVLEYASQVWDVAGSSSKRRLDSVQRGALRAAAGVPFSSSLDALQVYCNVLPLQLRRDLLVVSSFQRIIRLSSHHPIHRAFLDWRAAGCPTLRHSVFTRASAVLSRLTRFDLIHDGGFSSAEPLALPQSVTPPWCLTVNAVSPFTSFSRDFAHALHDVILCLLLRSHRDLFVYTDGSATGLGFCGAAVSFFSSACGEWSTFSSPVGIGSSLTAELRALELALLRVSVIVADGVVQIRRVFMFSDSQAAIGLLQGYFRPTCHFALVSSICSQIARLRRVLSLFILWIPRTARIEGNVRADQAARSAAAEVSGMFPGQPLIPLAVSRSLCRFAMHRSWQSSWSFYLQSRVGIDTLGRIRQVIGKWHVVSLGTRAQQSLMARLRLGHCGLRAHCARFRPSISSLCVCGLPETVGHFLLECVCFSLQRAVMLTAVRFVYPATITESVLLGDPEIPLSGLSHLAIVSAVFTYVTSTDRHP
jgi:ribonuclease HI